MTSLSQLREQLGTVITEAVGDDVPVFSGWPSNVSAPCVVVSMGPGTQRKADHWETIWRVAAIGPSGDNLAAAQWVEDLTLTLAQAISAAFTAGVTWEQPMARVVAGATYYSCQLSVTLDTQP